MMSEAFRMSERKRRSLVRSAFSALSRALTMPSSRAATRQNSKTDPTTITGTSMPFPTNACTARTAGAVSVVATSRARRCQVRLGSEVVAASSETVAIEGCRAAVPTST